MIKPEISLNIELNGKIEKQNQIKKKEYKFPKNLMMMDKICIFFK